MTVELQATEGFITSGGYRLWYKIVGEQEEAGRLPLLCLHGGPGVPHDYLELLEAMTATGRRVILYDQLGCGNSAHPHESSLWTVRFFLDELATVRDVLALEQVHLYGHSWGGMLAMEYALTQPEGLASLILADSPASVPQFVEGTNRLRAQLPAEVQETLILSGRYDEVTPEVMETVHQGIPGSEWFLFENSSHMAHLEEPLHYLQTLEHFLSRVEGRA